MKHTLKRLVILGILASSISLLFSNGLENKNAIGVYVIGAESPIGGIQYERHFSDLISEKFGVYAFYNNDYTSNPFEFNVTAETDFKLYETNWKDKVSSRLFAFAMLGYDIKIERETNYVEPEDSYLEEKVINNALAAVGFGFDFIFFDHLSMPVQFGFIGTFPGTPNIGLGGGVALRYSW